MKLIFFAIFIVLFCVALGALASIIVFCVDVFMWHNKEKRVVVIPSAEKLTEESEVKDNGRNNSDTSDTDTANAGQSDPSTVLPSWLRS